MVSRDRKQCFPGPSHTRSCTLGREEGWPQEGLPSSLGASSHWSGARWDSALRGQSHLPPRLSLNTQKNEKAICQQQNQRVSRLPGDVLWRGGDSGLSRQGRRLAQLLGCLHPIWQSLGSSHSSSPYSNFLLMGQALETKPPLWESWIAF